MQRRGSHRQTRRQRGDGVVLAWLVRAALAAAETLAAEEISAGVEGPRTLVLLNAETPRRSVRKQGGP
jgi:pyruvate/2-oxoglutarate/acetoin dehydrogenase E1 component